MSNLGKAAQARRYYHHVLNGGNLTPDNVSLMVQAIEELEAENARNNASIDALKLGLNELAAIAKERADRIEELEAKLATARNDALEEAAQELDCGCNLSRSLECDIPDLCPKINVAAIRALKSTSQT